MPALCALKLLGGAQNLPRIYRQFGTSNHRAVMKMLRKELVDIYSMERLNKPVQVFIWSIYYCVIFGKYGMNSEVALIKPTR